MIPAGTNLGTTNTIVGDHELTFEAIYNLVLNIFLDKFTMVGEFPVAARVLREALDIGIKDNKFYWVKLGDLRVLICNDYLGPKNHDRVYDFFIVDNVPTIFIFADSIKSEKVKRDVRVARIIDLFTVLVELMSTQEYFNIVGSIYSKVIEAAPVVMSIKLIKAVYGRDFVYEKDWNPEYYGESFGWVTPDVVKAVYSFELYNLLNYGSIVILIDHYYNF